MNASLRECVIERDSRDAVFWGCGQLPSRADQDALWWVRRGRGHCGEETTRGSREEARGKSSGRVCSPCPMQAGVEPEGLCKTLGRAVQTVGCGHCWLDGGRARQGDVGGDEALRPRMSCCGRTRDGTPGCVGNCSLSCRGLACALRAALVTG